MIVCTFDPVCFQYALFYYLTICIKVILSIYAELSTRLLASKEVCYVSKIQNISDYQELVSHPMSECL